VDRPFVPGPNVKILEPAKTLDAKFLFYYLMQLRIKSRGYADHFPEVRRCTIPIPALAEQKRIAAILDKADAIRRRRQEAARLADSLISSVFYEMFGDPVANTRRLPTCALEEYGQIVTGNTPPRVDSQNYGDGIEWIKSDNINTPYHVLTTATERLSPQGQAIARTAPAGSTLITCIAGSRECVGNAALTDREVAFNQQINAIIPASTVHPWALYVLLLVSQRLVQSASTDSMKGMVSKSALSEVQVLELPPQDQLVLGQRAEAIYGQLCAMEVCHRASDDLFNALVQRAFRGEL
jgi:type I restriction enzyme S subunit